MLALLTYGVVKGIKGARGAGGGPAVEEPGVMEEPSTTRDLGRATQSQATEAAPKTGVRGNPILDEGHVAKHLPDTPQSQRLIRREGAAHVFTDRATMERVSSEIQQRGEFTGVVRGAERYGLRFPEPIGYRIAADGSKIPLYYGEMKVSGGLYHVIPRTGPSK